MDMEHEIKKADLPACAQVDCKYPVCACVSGGVCAAPSAQQAAGSIADDPQYKRMLWNVAQDWTRTDRHIALACYIERWADSRAAATPAQPIATPITALLAKWETRAANAHPSDAMLINKHIRELKEAADASAAQPIAPPKVRFMWSSLFTNTATGIRFALSAAHRSDFDLMVAELLESPEIDTAKVYEIAVLKRADYESIIAQPIADVSAPSRLDLMSLIRSQMHRSYTAGHEGGEIDPKYIIEIEDAVAGIYHGRYIAGYDLRKSEEVAPAANVSAPTDEQVEAALVVYMAAWTDHDSMSQCKRNGIRAVLEFAARAAAPADQSPYEAITLANLRAGKLSAARVYVGYCELSEELKAANGAIKRYEAQARAAAPVSGPTDA